MSGSLPPALGNLTELGTLDLSSNPLSGTLPPTMGGMAGLRALHLAGTRLSGDIPEAWKSLRLGEFRTSGSMLCLPEDMVSWYLAIRQHDYLDFKELSGGLVEYSPKESCTEELSFNEQTIGDQSYEVRADLSGNPIASLTLPEATGGAGMLTYELAPALPVGLSFNGQTRVISGTPTQLHGAGRLFLHGPRRERRDRDPHLHDRRNGRNGATPGNGPRIQRNGPEGAGGILPCHGRAELEEQFRLAEQPATLGLVRSEH